MAQALAGAPEAWAAAIRQLGEAGGRIAQLMRERGEPPDSADPFLALLGATMDAYLNQISADSDNPSFLPCCGYFQHTGSPNPDTVYRRAPIDGSGTYRITGERGTAQQVTIMPFANPGPGGMASWPPFDLSEVTDDPEGHFDVIMSPQRPPGYSGHWWPLEPEMASLWLRVVSDDWGREREPRIAITRIDRAGERRAQRNAAIGTKLSALGVVVERTIAYGIGHADELVEEGFVNRLKLVDYGASGGMPLQWYHEGAFELRDDEALLIESALPEGCDYFSFSLTDRMLVTLDWVHAQTSLNRKQAVVDDDGRLRVVVAGRDPGVLNWMDTTGLPRGVVQCRWIGSTEPPEVSSRVIPAASVAEHLPEATRRITAEERLEALQRRSVGAQLRSLW